MILDKRAVFQAFFQQVKDNMEAIRASAAAAHEAATGEESRAENEYDTRGLEASYLAGAQSRRAVELEEVLVMFHALLSEKTLLPFAAGEGIALTALVTVATDGKEARYLLLAKGGGFATTVRAENRDFPIQVVTPKSPLGAALMGKRVGDEFELEIQGRHRDCEIVAVQ